MKPWNMLAAVFSETDTVFDFKVER